jgi:RNA polymerase sigma-70 factor (ECF subfamily)
VVTWVFSIALNRARTRATREGRLVGLPALMDGTPPPTGGLAVDGGDRSPAGQRAVIILRDIEGCEAEEACTLLGITANNQRTSASRARA